MNAIQLLSGQPWVERLGWTLVHFLWQGLLIAALYGAARKWIARRWSPDKRYILACVALAALVVAPLATWSLIRPWDAAPQTANCCASGLDQSGERASGDWVVAGEIGFDWPGQLLPWVVAVWLAGAMAFWVRLIGGWVAAVRLRSVLVRPAPHEWQQTLDRLKARVRVSRPVRLLTSSLVQVPTVVGWLRPVVLTPVGALAGLPPEQMEALLIHELAHVRRHDYLVNILQSVAEALLFYHPAVWWVSGHIRIERELCCDDAAVSLSGDALTYARALAELESCRPAHMNAAVAANGGSLADRIGRLLGQSRPVSQTRSGPGVIVSAMVLLIAVLAVFAQPATPPLLELDMPLVAPPPPPLQEPPPPRFEVASIKLNTSEQPRLMSIRPLPGGRLTAASVPVKFLIQYAYRLKPFQISGGPGWIDSEQYDIEAKAEGDAGGAQMRLMMQTLLEDRFKLRFHGEKKELPVYVLTAARGGIKLQQPRPGGCITPDTSSPLPPLPGQIVCGRPSVAINALRARMQGGKVPMTEFTDVLSNMLGRTVVDKTGFAGTFDVNLEFTADQALAGIPTPVEPGNPAAPAPSADPARPSIFSALQEQLGLKLESTKGPVDVLVIDHVERPTAN